jgi:hypothetical protein
MTCLGNRLAAKVGNHYRRRRRELSTHPRQPLLGLSKSGLQPLNLLEALKRLLPLLGVNVLLSVIVDGGHPACELLRLEGLASRR